MRAAESAAARQNSPAVPPPPAAAPAMGRDVNVDLSRSYAA